jgi:hypothetical protein
MAKRAFQFAIKQFVAIHVDVDSLMWFLAMDGEAAFHFYHPNLLYSRYRHIENQSDAYDI